MSHHFQEMNDPNFDIFYGAPALIVISTATQIPWKLRTAHLLLKISCSRRAAWG